MEAPAETKEETKHSRGFGSYLVWVGVVLVLYVLSMGPAVMIDHKGVLEAHTTLGNSLTVFYAPMTWAYMETPLYAPIRMYLHLWCPSDFY